MLDSRQYHAIYQRSAARIRSLLLLGCPASSQHRSAFGAQCRLHDSTFPCRKAALWSEIQLHGVFEILDQPAVEAPSLPPALRFARWLLPNCAIAARLWSESSHTTALAHTRSFSTASQTASDCTTVGSRSCPEWLYLTLRTSHSPLFKWCTGLTIRCPSAFTRQLLAASQVQHEATCICYPALTQDSTMALLDASG